MSILGSLIEPATKLLDKVIEDKDQKAALAHEIATMAEKHAQELAKGQSEINKAEAAHKSMFVAGWRPFVGWTCGVALAWHFVGQPIAIFVITFVGVDTPPLPVFEMESLLTVLLGMLGLGGLRSWEKTKQVAREK